jgi:hypothetical protein
VQHQAPPLCEIYARRRCRRGRRGLDLFDTFSGGKWIMLMTAEMLLCRYHQAVRVVYLDPRLQPLRGDARFEDLLRRMGCSSQTA